jgi:glycosyltransferase involved in cell wall biosynthesis
MSAPLVSIIIPSYNQGRFIRKTIESCLQQDHRPLEILVIDGSSTDETVDVLRSFGDIPELKWISEKDNGVVDAVNKGLARAKGAIAGIQSSDDTYLPGAVSQAVKAFSLHPEACLVFGDVLPLDAEGNMGTDKPQPAFSLARLLSRRLYVPQPAAFFRTQVAVSSGGWDERIPYVPDTDLWFRLSLRHPVVKLDGFIACSRKHPGQRDKQSARIYRDYMLMLEQSPDLAAAPARLRRAARAGGEILKLRYGGPWTDREISAAIWKAICLHPPLLFSPAIPLHRKIPGYFALTRLRRSLFGKSGSRSP